MLDQTQRAAIVREYDALPHGSRERAELLRHHGIGRTALANWRKRLGLRRCGCGADLPRYQRMCTRCRRVRARRAHVTRTYQLSAEEYDRMVEEQGGRCAACGELPNPDGLPVEQSLHVDHDHETGEVRGLLCNRCNLALGYAHESIARLWGLIRYLIRSRAR